MLARRELLRWAAVGAAAMVVQPRIVFARAATTQRFVFVIQRGAADGLSTVVPHGDPAYRQLRGELAYESGDLLPVDGLFGLHPELAQLHALYGEGQALLVQAVASPYRERSHFDGQNILETGGTRANEVSDGWLNRLLSILPAADAEAVAYAPTVPLALRGDRPVTSIAPSSLPDVPDDLLLRVSRLYEADPQLHPLFDAAMDARELTGALMPTRDPIDIGRGVGSLLGTPDGPRIAMIETGGWDTHQRQPQRLARLLGGLDGLLDGLRQGLGPAWNNTAVLIATEFGRTATINGTQGTDHGTAAVSIMAGGMVKGGKILGDWPGLKQSALFEGRDLMPTMDLNRLIAGAAAGTFGLDPGLVSRTLFPGQSVPTLLEELVRA